jgi:Uma2 family endonuclease
MGERAPALISEESYLEAEKAADQKHEYLGGTIHAMAGASRTHNHIAANCLASLHSQLRGQPCFPVGSDTKIRIRYPDHTRFYYPDAGIVCEANPGDSHFEDRPVLIVEVLSPSTRRHDLQEKRDAYLTIPSLQAYLMIDTDAPDVLVYERIESQFVARQFVDLDAVVTFTHFEIELPLAELYEHIDFSAKEAD